MVGRSTAGNVARVTTGILVGDVFGQKAAAMIEQKFGFITFAVAIGGVLATGWLIRSRKGRAEA